MSTYRSVLEVGIIGSESTAKSEVFPCLEQHPSSGVDNAFRLAGGSRAVENKERSAERKLLKEQGATVTSCKEG